MHAQQRLKLLTYNIHSGIGRDRRYDLDRIAGILEEEQADIIALQEVERGSSRTRNEDQPARLAGHLGMHYVFQKTSRLHGGEYGLAVLSRLPVVGQQAYDLSYRIELEPRFCLRVDVELSASRRLHLFNCHLGLRTLERRHQRRLILSQAILLSRDLRDPVALLGDFNDRPISVIHPQLRKYFQDAYRAAGRRFGSTFQLGFIRWRLDHIYLSFQFRVIDCWIRRDSTARVASDHRPVVATVDLDVQSAAD